MENEMQPSGPDKKTVPSTPPVPQTEEVAVAVELVEPEPVMLAAQAFSGNNPHESGQ
jgi:hypothetical protein